MGFHCGNTPLCRLTRGEMKYQLKLCIRDRSIRTSVILSRVRDVQDLRL